MNVFFIGKSIKKNLLDLHVVFCFSCFSPAALRGRRSARKSLFMGCLVDSQRGNYYLRGPFSPLKVRDEGRL